MVLNGAQMPHHMIDILLNVCDPTYISLASDSADLKFRVISATLLSMFSKAFS